MTETLACARHGEPTGLRCVSCDTPICPRCLVRTDVGQRCEDCGRPTTVPARAAAGATRSRTRTLAMAGGAVLVVVALAVLLLRPSDDNSSESTPVVEATAGSWEEIAPLASVRGSTAAVTLKDGTVLVAGGGVSAIPVAAAELFDPATGKWTTAAPMAQARRGHQAALLDDGRVLVAGGVSAAGALATAEVFDPAAGTWTTTAPMATPRLGHSLTTLADGRVLVAGGSALDSAGTGGVTPLATTELYDPTNGRWEPGPAMATPRFEHTATRLEGGRVLVAGGLGAGAGQPSRDAEIFDPAAGVFVAAAPMADARTNHAATALADHRVLVVGGAGGRRGDVALRSVEIFDPERNAWSRAPALARARTGATATMTNGAVLVAGGEAVDGGVRRSMPDAELFDPTADKWLSAGAMTCPRSEQAAAPLNGGGVLIVAGDGAFPGQPPVAQGCADLYHPESG